MIASFVGAAMHAVTQTSTVALIVAGCLVGAALAAWTDWGQQ